MLLRTADRTLLPIQQGCYGLDDSGLGLESSRLD